MGSNATGSGTSAKGTYDNTTGIFSFYHGENTKGNHFRVYIVTI